jgi:ribonuclease T1
MRTRLLNGLAFGLALLCLVHGTAAARGERMLEVRMSDLPREAVVTLDLIAGGGPFPHARDGVVFGNRERLLPLRPRGYYLEYTVRTPGVRSRGARRIVCGGEPRATRDCYYSDDHYQSFRRIR